MAAVGVRPGQAGVELVQLPRVEQVLHRPDIALEHRPPVDRGVDQVLLGGAQRPRHLVLAEVADLVRLRQPDARGARGVVRGLAAREGRGGRHGGHRTLGHERYHVDLELLAARRLVGLVRVADAHVDREAEGHHDQQDHGDRLPGQAARQHMADPDRAVGVVQPLLGGELLDPGSSDERLVEDDGSVLFLAPARATLRWTFGSVSLPAHITRLSL